MGGRQHLNILWMTDPHIDHLSQQQRERWFDRIEAFGGDAILLTGDIAEADTVADVLVEVAARHHTVWFVLGNHDYYGSSIVEVRARMNRLWNENGALTYLSQSVPICIGTSAVLGIDGWADGRAGAFMTSEIMLNDYVRIQELKNLGRFERFAQLKQQGDAEAAALRQKLAQLDTEVIRQLFIATHVPPFAEACWYEGSNTINEWTPHFTSIAVGEVLLDFARSHPDISIEVYCGHSHHEGSVDMRNNLQVHTGRAVYGDWSPHYELCWE